MRTKTNLSKTARRRRRVVFLIELALVAAAILAAVLLAGWAVSRLTGPLIGLMDSAADVVIG